MRRREITEKTIFNLLKRKGLLKNNCLKVRFNSSNKSLKEGDFVMTFEIHQVKERFEHNKKEFSCVQVLPLATYPNKQGIGQHEYIKQSGTGQQGITKLLRWQ